MARIYIESAKARTALSQQEALERALQALSKDVGGIRRGLNYKIAGRETIDARLRDAINQVNKEVNSTKALRMGLEQIIVRYEQAENSNTDRVVAEKTSAQNRDSISQDQSTKTDKNDDLDNQILALIKAILSWADKTKTSDKAGLGKSGFSYIESLVDFFTGDKRGLTGAEDLFDLGDKSIGLWTEFYDYLKGFYNGAGNTFSITNQRYVAGLGITGGIFELISSACGIADTISNTENIGPARIIGEVLGGGDSVVDIWSGVEKLKHVGDASTSGGIYSPLSFYSTIAKSYIAAFSQGFKSYDKYAADGVWDLDDTGKTGVEFAVAGLYSMINSLSFGLSDQIADASGVSADSISESIENWASDVGKRAGNYILNDPALYDAYNNSVMMGPMGRVAITFYAAFRACWQ